MKLRHAATLLVMLAACGRGDRPEALPIQTPTQTAVLIPASSPWTWHPLGGLAVVEGELAEATELILEGRSIREHRFAEQGPVRWEFFRPPEGEVALLRTADGRELARFEFSLPKAPPRSPATRLARRPEPPAPPRPVIAPKVNPAAQPDSRPAARPMASLPPSSAPKPTPSPAFSAKISPAPSPAPPAAPKPEPPAPTPKTFAEARLRNLPVQPIPGRKAIALPRAAEAPTEVPRRASTFRPIPIEPVAPRPAKPVPPAPVAQGGAIFPVGPVPPMASVSLPEAGMATKAWPGMGEALNLTRGPGGQKRILLSFDGGSNSEVAAEVLDLLKARGIHTTLFLTGAFIQKFPALVKRMAAEGHELGNHTMNHPHFAPDMKRDPKWTRERVQRELLDADAALLRLIGRPMDPYWRAPYGEHTAEIRRWAEELGYRHVGWSEGADTLDWATPKDRRLYRSGEAIVKRLEQRLDRNGDGLIVLMHLGSERALGDRPTDGLGAYMDRARREGWTFISVSAFLRDLGKPAWDPHQRLALLNGTPAPSPSR